MTLSRFLAFPFVALMGLGVIMGLAVLVWAVPFSDKGSDLKGTLTALGLVTWWAWLGISVYVRHIKKPREEEKRLRAEALALVEKTITPGSRLSAIVDVLRKNLPLVGEPRHRSSSDPSFDSLVEIEAHGFIVSLFSRDGVIQSWSVR